MPTTIKSSNIPTGTVTADDLASTLDISSKTVTLPTAAVTSHVTAFDDNQLKEDIALLAFKQATSDSVVKYDLVDQSIDVFSDASGINTGASTNETRDTSGKYYSGLIFTDASPTGGTTSTYGSTKVNTYLTDDNFVVTASGNVDMLIVGGGGGGADNGNNYHVPGGGGGAGGMRVITGIAVTAQTYAIDVGDGGAGGTGASGANANGSNSTALGYTASGGGKGGIHGSGGSGGGSGGGGAGNQGGGGGNSGGYSPVEGYSGASGGIPSGYNAGWYVGGGGGGAGEVGASYLPGDTIQYPTGGAGGDGLENNYRTGSNVFYAGGGGGGGFYTVHGAGGQGGGAAGSSTAGPPGTANTGGGGGGAGGHPAYNGSAGGSGIVVIKYPDDEFVSSAEADLTLVSNSVTAETQPTKADLVMTYTNGAGTATIGTDLTAEVTRDGSTWTSFGLSASSDQGDTGGHTILTAHDIDISGQPAGTSMQYRIKTLNQSATKATRIHAVSLGWS